MSINTRNQFVAAAKSITAVINGQALGGRVKLFSTGSCGWYVNGKVEATLSAAPLTVTIAGTPLQADFKEFSSGNRGWYLSTKVMVPVAGGELVRCQVGASMTLVGSKGGATSGKLSVGINVIAIGSKTWEYGEEVVMAPEQVKAQKLADEAASQAWEDSKTATIVASQVRENNNAILAAVNAMPTQVPNLMDAFMTPVVVPAAQVNPSQGVPANLMDAFYVNTPVLTAKVVTELGVSALTILRALSTAPAGLTGRGIHEATTFSGPVITRWTGFRSMELNQKAHPDNLINRGLVSLGDKQGVSGMAYVITDAGHKYLATTVNQSQAAA